MCNKTQLAQQVLHRIHGTFDCFAFVSISHRRMIAFARRSSFFGNAAGVDASEEKDDLGSMRNLQVEIPDMTKRKTVSDGGLAVSSGWSDAC